MLLIVGWKFVYFDMQSAFEKILTVRDQDKKNARIIGESRQGRPIFAFRYGQGPLGLSLLAGCHADEPVGPRFLRALCSYLAFLPADHRWFKDYTWHLIPHINPDGEIVNQRWYDDTDETYDLVSYLKFRVREKPGDDIEFNFPFDSSDQGARLENRAVYDWWRDQNIPFHLHCSLHGMTGGAGPWFLIEPTWIGRTQKLRTRCEEQVHEMGYKLHDIERQGEKGFHRISPGFCTRPDSQAMRDFFMSRNDPETAHKFRPSSMESIRSLYGDVLTLVSEMPLFIFPGIGEKLGPPDPVAEQWKERLETWTNELEKGNETLVRREVGQSGLRAMPVRHQMKLQWRFITAGIKAVQRYQGID
ncbi:peptidase [candidate division KSB1 bacterium]|nr:peptidase [candidate division KSB1 bacterium]